MPEEQSTIFNREQLYNEIWEISVSGVAKKYNVSYSELLKLCKEANIPIPPSGYWTKLSFGKQVSKISLPNSSITEINLPHFTPKNSKKKPNSISPTDIENEIELQEKQPLPKILETDGAEQLIYRTVTGKQNKYNRDKLYEEVWQKPVSEVAIQYGVSDVTIHKVCKTLNVPVPYRGYWAKIRSGLNATKTPLAATDGPQNEYGQKTFEAITLDIDTTHVLSFLPEDERERVLLVASQIKLPAENPQLHKKITAYKSVIKEWNKNDIKQEGAKRSINNYTKSPPFLAGVISEETIPRVYRILDALYRAVERLGGTVNDNLSLIIRNENVSLEISEEQDEIKHELTRKEAQELLIYEDAKRHHSWASEPKIRKYDYIFNGRIKIKMRARKYIKDTEKIKLEDKLGEMLIELYEQSEVVRIDREDREEASRKQAEERRLREERRNNYNHEIDLTIALENAALDYEAAYRIRAFVNAVEASFCNVEVNDEAVKWIEWARKKADWYDPTVARVDDFLGKREHEKSQDKKALEKDRRYW